MMKRTHLLSVLAVCLVIVAGCGDRRRGRSGRGESTLKRGDTIRTTQRCFVGTTAVAYERVTEASIASDGATVETLVDAGAVLVVQGGTRAKLVEIGVATHKIRLLDGPHTGKTGFVAVEFVAK